LFIPRTIYDIKEQLYQLFHAFGTKTGNIAILKRYTQTDVSICSYQYKGKRENLLKRRPAALDSEHF